MTHHTLDYARRIREQGYRLTPQRELILDAVCEGGGHTTIDEIYGRLQKKAPAISLATLYRTLDFFCELHLVVSAEIDGQTVYEIAGLTPHHHLICRECGASIHIDHELVQELFDKFQAEYGYTIDMDHMAFTGLCPACRAKAGAGE
jgi:Fur family ferric uptake transcriptional regulator